MNMLDNLKNELRKFADPKKAQGLMRFFKTAKGEYGEGDKFLGVMVPETRSVAWKFKGLPVAEVLRLLKSKWHEERLCALVILVYKFEEARNDDEKKIVFDIYLDSTKYINNWDLVDVSAHKIVGRYLIDKPRNILYKLARSQDLWEKRIAIISTMAFIARGEFDDSLKISEILLKDKHDLIHKAVGWTLREVGKKDLKTLEKFLDEHAAIMPRTMLRYAIEKLPELDRKKFLLALVRHSQTPQ